MPDEAEFSAPISREIWDLKYRLKSTDGGKADSSLDDTFWRVARAAATAEKGGKKAREKWAKRFHGAMSDLGFLPAGRILAGAGTGRSVTLFNCFVLGTIDDDLSAIFANVKDAALTMQQGGGIGHDFSTLRPKGAPVASIGADASGPVSFMEVWDAMCRTIMSAGSRRGAMMGTLRCDHPDIEAFIEAKSEPGRLRNFNLSVLVTDDFLAAVRADCSVGPEVRRQGLPHACRRARCGSASCAQPTTTPSRASSSSTASMPATTSTTANRSTPPILAANSRCRRMAPACLARSTWHDSSSIRSPAAPPSTGPSSKSGSKWPCASSTMSSTFRITRSRPQRREAQAKRRIGLGITGLADALIFAGVRYGTPEAARLAGSWMAIIQNAAYAASAELAAEKGTFPLYDAKRFLASPNVAALDAPVREAIRRHGVRNGCLTSIAPTGTISLLAGNVSSGIEPVFDYRYSRRLLARDGTTHEQTVEDYAHAQFRRQFGSRGAAARDIRRAPAI